MGTAGATSRSTPGLAAGSTMIERSERKPYWRHTKAQMLASLLPFVLAIIVLPLYADALNEKRFLGIPLGYFLACHGLFQGPHARFTPHHERGHHVRKDDHIADGHHWQTFCIGLFL